MGPGNDGKRRVEVFFQKRVKASKKDFKNGNVTSLEDLEEIMKSW
ncbi:MAG: hypothetical protein ACI9XO_003322 [Paraglaciecola sp.]